MAGHQKLNINEASLDELERIPGVDHGIAETLVHFREQRGGIYNIEELTDVKQIEPGEMNRLREWLTVGSERSGFLDYEGTAEEPDSL
jgi:competence protein ComEA